MTDTKISSKYFTKDWMKLDLSNAYSNDWQNAIEIFKNRFETRFFKPIESLCTSTDSTVKYSCGFIIMSLDCILLETFNQFYHGINTSDDKFSPNILTFNDILTRSEYFNKDFVNNDIVKVFYKQIRCGLVHQSETGGESKINIKNNNLITIIESGDNLNIEINRNEFHDRVKKYFNGYLEDLRNPIEKNLRNNFKIKMDLITKK